MFKYSRYSCKNDNNLGMSNGNSWKQSNKDKLIRRTVVIENAIIKLSKLCSG